MANKHGSRPEYARGLRRLLVSGAFLLVIAIFLLWRIDNDRVEQFRISVIDRFVPSFEWTVKPLASVSRLLTGFSSYQNVYEQNTELRRELQRMQGWREAALQLEQKNAKLLALNNVRLNPRLSYVTAEVMADSGSPFRRSAMLNVGGVDGVEDGWVVVDGLGLVGRIAGTAGRSSRVIFINDGSSRVPGIVRPSGQTTLVSGDNTSAPLLDFLDRSESVRPGDRVVSTGDGGLYPPGILIGQVVRGKDGRLRTRPAADYRRLDFVRVLRTQEMPLVSGPGRLIGPLEASIPARQTPDPAQ